MRFVLSLSCVCALVACPVVGEGEGEGAEGEGEGEGAEGEGEGEGEGGARFVAVGYGGRRLTSVDGRVWDNDIEDAANGGDDDNLFRGVCAGVVDGVTVVLAVGGSVQGRVARSIDGGASWTQIVDDDGWIGGCAFHDSVFVFVGSARSARSLDGGLTLVDQATHFLANGNWEMRDVEVVDGVFVAVGDTGVSTSIDGVTWPDPSGPVDVFRIAAGNGVAVVVGAGKHATSSDLVVWDEVADGANDLVFAEGQFLLVGEGFRLTSTDGATFLRANQPAMGRVSFGVVDGVPTWLGANFSDVRRLSTDGENWTDVANDGGNAIDDIVFVD